MSRFVTKLLAHGPIAADVWNTTTEADQVTQPGGYPFRKVVPREPLKVLRGLLGVGLRNGGTILVTGCRGSGKTTAVNQALYDAGLLGRGFPSKEGTFRSDREAFQKLDALLGKKANGLVVPRLAQAKPPANEIWMPRVTIEVRLNLARPLGPDALIRRIVREFYLALVRSGVAGLVPDLISEARTACIRTSASISEEAAETVLLKTSTSISAEIGNEGFAVSLSEAANEEIQTARKIAVQLGPSDKEEMEEHLLRSMQRLDGTIHGHESSLATRLLRSVNWLQSARDAVSSLRLWFQGTPGVRTNVVFVVDELDKLEEQPNTQGGAVEPPAEDDSPDLKKPTKESSPDVDSLATAIKALKPLVASANATFVFVSGREDAIRWHEQGGDPNSLLRSAFSGHVHFGLMRPDEVDQLLADRISVFRKLPESERELLSGWAMFESKGSYTRTLSLLREACARETSTANLLRRFVRQAVLGLCAKLTLWSEEFVGEEIECEAYVDAIREQFLRTLYGETVRSSLADAWEESPDLIVRDRLREAAQIIDDAALVRSFVFRGLGGDPPSRTDMLNAFASYPTLLSAAVTQALAAVGVRVSEAD